MNPLLALVGVLVVLAAALVFSLGIGGFLTASAQDTFIVNDDTTPTDGGCGTPDFQTKDINDEYDDPSSPAADCPGNDKGAVVVHPWLATLSTSTPTPTPSPNPTATPSDTRAIHLSPPGWHDLAWSGADGTDPATALACISGKYSIAYAWEGPTAGFKRYVEGCPVAGICNMEPLNEYDSLFVAIAALGVICHMPVAPSPRRSRLTTAPGMSFPTLSRRRPRR